MKRTYLHILFIGAVVALMSGCGKGSNTDTAQVVTTNGNTLGTINPNSNLFLNNNCPTCQYQITSNCNTQLGIHTSSGVCITNPGHSNFGGSSVVHENFQHAVSLCMSYPNHPSCTGGSYPFVDQFYGGQGGGYYNGYYNTYGSGYGGYGYY